MTPRGAQSLVAEPMMLTPGFQAELIAADSARFGSPTPFAIEERRTGLPGSRRVQLSVPNSQRERTKARILIPRQREPRRAPSKA